MRSFAQVVSTLCHPLLMITYGLILMVLVNPHSFGYTAFDSAMPLLIITLAYTFGLPLIAILVMKMLGLIQTVQLKSREERIGPLIVCIVFYTWFFINMYHHANMPPLLTVFTLGSVLALSLAFFISLFEKVSLHTMGLGGLAGLLLMMLWRFNFLHLELFEYRMHIKMVVIGLFFLVGLVASMRMVLKAHVPRELYGGFIIGLATQFIALRILL